MVNPFYNRNQRRIRAAWRLLLLGIIVFLGTVLSGMVLGAVVVGYLRATGQLTPALMADRAALTELVTKQAMSFPYLMLVTGLIELAYVLLACGLAARFFDRRPFADFGFHLSRAWWRDFGFGLGLGAALMVGIFLVELAAGWITVTGTLVAPQAGASLPGALLAGAIGFILVGFNEELLSRGYVMRNLAEGLRWRFISPRGALLLAYVLSSVLFGFMHQGNPNASGLTTPLLALAGLFLGLGFLLTGELAISIGVHITWNFFQGYVFGFPVSGTPHVASLIGIQQGGPLVWTGGAWGPEAGIIGLLALVVGSLLIIAWVRRTRGMVRPEDRLAVYQRPGTGGVNDGEPAPAMGEEAPGRV